MGLTFEAKCILCRGNKYKKMKFVYTNPDKSREYKKAIMLLLLPTLIKVSRGNDESQLQKLGCYADAVRFSKVQ